jgi:4-aminobutyrate aminotransferase-like enzyme
MIVTITSLKLKSIWKFFGLAHYALKILRQTKDQKGIIQFKKTGFGMTHYTMSAWESEADMRAFAGSGAHLQAMKDSKKIASEIRVYTFETDTLPNWDQAKTQLLEKGRLLKFDL